MNIEDKKAVTEWLGECMHADYPICAYCGKDRRPNVTSKTEITPMLSAFGSNRTFTEWSDFGACWERLKVKKKFEKFETYLLDRNIVLTEDILFLLSRTEDSTFRLCNLIAEALEEGVVK